MEEVEMLQINEMVKGMSKKERLMLYESKKKNVGLAVLLSILIPGAGLMYIGKVFKGVIVLLLCWTVILYIYGIVASYREAKNYNAMLYTIIFGGSGKS